MDLITLFGTDIFNWVIMPLLIFVSRVLDVSFGTLRVIFVSQGYKKVATTVAFFEILIWLLVARQVITNLDNFTWIIAYCFGYAAGTYIGISVCEKLSIGKVIVRTIIKNNCDELIDELKANEFGVTVLGAQTSKENSTFIFSIISLKDFNDYMKIVQKNNPKAFYSVESVKTANEGFLQKT